MLAQKLHTLIAIISWEIFSEEFLSMNVDRWLLFHARVKENFNLRLVWRSFLPKCWIAKDNLQSSHFGSPNFGIISFYFLFLPFAAILCLENFIINEILHLWGEPGLCPEIPSLKFRFFIPSASDQTTLYQDINFNRLLKLSKINFYSWPSTQFMKFMEKAWLKHLLKGKKSLKIAPHNFYPILILFQSAEKKIFLK